jgi:hypothetical protein
MNVRRIAFAALLVAGCAHYQTTAMGPELIEQHGTRVYHQSPARVWKAAELALKTTGYEIAVEDTERGIITTTPKLIRVVARGDGYRAATSGLSTQYVLDIATVGNDVRVRATPRAYANGVERPSDSWNVEWVKASWDTLFRNLETYL